MESLSPVLEYPVSNWRLKVYRIGDMFMADPGSEPPSLADAGELEKLIQEYRALQNAEPDYANPEWKNWYRKSETFGGQCGTFRYLFSEKGLAELIKVLPKSQDTTHHVADESIVTRLREAAEA
jgi:hypothetical protein